MASRPHGEATIEIKYSRKSNRIPSPSQTNSTANLGPEPAAAAGFGGAHRLELAPCPLPRATPPRPPQADGDWGDRSSRAGQETATTFRLTTPSPKGLYALSQQPRSIVLDCPGARKGQVRVERYGARKTKFINAHTSCVACFALSQDGKLIASASTKGALVRIINAVEGNLLHEVRSLNKYSDDK
ncbi:hypothetical protein BRADI_3g14050v3 [Brachypodium distachyon]|uniref:Uncharacterized protein n=1 Tax=Brachypodium distachyon TaxID=15368 RepID=I1I0L4_BRADI|nr:hypothetical protein BRADI_3g14050v3 [Brachypodium distachyon]